MLPREMRACSVEQTDIKASPNWRTRHKMAALPYLASPNSIKVALERIRSAATPDRVTTDFVTTKLQIKGGTGFAILPFLKKIG